jgi:hypothetical protein
LGSPRAATARSPPLLGGSRGGDRSRDLSKDQSKVLIINNPPDFGLAAGGAVEAVGRLAEETAEDSLRQFVEQGWDVLEPGARPHSL